MNIEETRKRIDLIDEKIAELFQQRMEAVEQIAELKKDNNTAVNDVNREKAIIEKNEPEIDDKWKPYYRRFMENLFAVSKDYQNDYIGKNDSLIKKDADFSVFRVKAFDSSNAAKASAKLHDDTINGTVGSFCGEDGKLYTFNSVYSAFENVPDIRKASYASKIEGNDDYNEAVFSWVNRLNNIKVPHKCVAAPGGTGAICLAVGNTIGKGDILLYPDIAWGSYKLMCGQFGGKAETYNLLDGDELSVKDIMRKCESVMERQHKVVLVVNDPCQNPTGMSFTKQQWKDLMDFLISLSERGPVMLIDDIAYLDFCNDSERCTSYMEYFNNMTDNMAVVITFSCSKSFTAYGMRLGDAIILSNNETQLDHLFNAFLRSARSWWSNVNNGFMDTVTEVIRHPETYLAEKKTAVELLKKRTDLFVKQADECKLPIYPYSDGFFVTIRVDDKDLLNRYTSKLEEDHVFCVPFSKGLRVALCGIPLAKVDGLAYRLKRVLDEVK